MTDIASLKTQFKNPDLLELALTHRSWINENKQIRPSNERLEFLGDAILEFIVSKEIYDQFPDKEEGYLTALRANLVNTQNLSKVALRLGLGEALYLSRGEDEGGGRNNASLLADTVEAVIGALYIDQGLEAAETFVQLNLLAHIDEKLAGPLKDAKSRLQEQVQSFALPTPKYRVANESGPDHSKVFEVEVLVGDKIYGSGSGKNKSEAEQMAAQNALDNDTVAQMSKKE